MGWIENLGGLERCPVTSGLEERREEPSNNKKKKVEREK